MKILIITPRIPYPPFRGDKLKIFNLCKILQKQNTVKILTFICKKEDFGFLKELRQKGFDLETIRLPRIISLLNLVRSLLSKNPLQISYYHSKKMHQKFKYLSSNEKYDLIYFHLINSVQYYKSVEKTDSLKVIDYTDATSLYLTRYIEFLKNPFRKIIFMWERKRTINYEKKAQMFDTLFVCSQTDKNYLIKNGAHNNIQLLLNGFNNESYQYEYVTPIRGRIIFTGNMTYFPNIDAVLFFAEKVFPLIIKKIPEAKFYIVGQNPPKNVLALNSENIIVKGFVDDIKAEYLLSEVNVAPVRFGSGTLNKIIESLALGIPTVATTLSIAGFPEEIKNFIFTADSPELFAEKVIDLIGNSSVRETFMKKASIEINKTLAWDTVVSSFENYIQNRILEKKNHS